MMKGFSQGVDLLLLEKDASSGGEYYAAQLGVNGIKCIVFSIPTPTIWDLMASGEESLAQYLERQARVMIEQYGDARSPRLDPALMEA